MIHSIDIFLAQKGDIESIEKIIQYYYPKIYNYNKYLFLEENNKDDLIQEGIIGLLKAIKYYDSLKQVSFNSFANICIQRNIISAVKKYNSAKHSILNKAIKNNLYKSQIFLFSTKKTPESYLLEIEFNNYIRLIFNTKLSALEKEIFLYLLVGYNYVEISKLLNKNIKQIDNGIQRIRKKIKQSNN